MEYRVEAKKQAIKELTKLQLDISRKILDSIESLASNPRYSLPFESLFVASCSIKKAPCATQPFILPPPRTIMESETIFVP